MSTADSRRRVGGDREHSGQFESQLAGGLSSSPSDIGDMRPAASYPGSYGPSPVWNHEPMELGRSPSMRYIPIPPSLLSSTVASLARGFDQSTTKYPAMSGPTTFYEQRNDCRGYGMASYFERPRFGRATSHAPLYMPADTTLTYGLRPSADGYPSPTMFEHPMSMSCDGPDAEAIPSPQCAQDAPPPHDAHAHATSDPSNMRGRAIGRKARAGWQGAPQSPAAGRRWRYRG
ncbi:hypothetical protein CBR_g38131 [Chara braunii]|uniref:Uncharacterized protein n=1 Tax=Chara braunii TaxID=69332 RepID=A0A388LP98_CHABU|nr:hypothetical protein CBR_g38131 [Chara braunii]|eukprot:GBG84157.1 hypothetical protein CBR_g38131 [Chara braunii]